MNVLLLTSHSIAEYDDLRMFADLGYDVFSIGAYTDPANPTDDKRPALPDAPQHPDLAALCQRQREKHAADDATFVIDWAKGDLHRDIVDWADAIIVHHFPVPWIVGNWPKFVGKRVIWRTCGQSNPDLERAFTGARKAGLEIVRYSPAERTYFERVGAFAGEDALIRFGKYPDDYGPWVGDDVAVGNITQNMKQRGDACGYANWQSFTAGLPVKPAGPGSEHLRGGIGPLSYDEMLDYLRHIRTYLYTGTQPASYTLGLIEAMLSGVPVLSVNSLAFGHEYDGLFEGANIAGLSMGHHVGAQIVLRSFLRDHAEARERGEQQRQRATDLFDVAKVGRQWVEFLGAPVTREPAEVAA